MPVLTFFLTLVFCLFLSSLHPKTKTQKKFAGLNWVNSASHVTHQVGVGPEDTPQPLAPKPASVSFEAANAAEAVTAAADEAAETNGVHVEAVVEEKKVSVSEEPGSATRSRSRSKSKKRKDEVGGGIVLFGLFLASK